jgi:UDP-N-acetylmuramyl pentapeptide phosphotransferase/UDP-N-acetylglucosamine-1-phosphate transferase
MSSIGVDPLFAPAIAALIAFGLTSVLLRRSRLPLDMPNERSLHSVPVPKIGGLALVPAVGCAWALVPEALGWAVWTAAGALFLLSWIDDVANLSAPLRLAVHLAAAALAAFALLGPEADWSTVLIAILAIAWMTNLFNFMDGADGLAGGMALFGFGAYAWAAWGAGNVQFAIAAAAVAAAAGAFLWFNFPPARVFLGDAGSIPLGFTAAAMGLHGWHTNLWPAWFPLVVFSPFVVDATVTLARRSLRGERIWQAHREHYYQRLVRSGWSHKRTALAEYALMACCAIASVWAIRLAPAMQAAFVAAWALSYAAILARIDRAWRRHGKET